MPRFGLLIKVYIVAVVTIHIYEISVATKITSPIGIGPAASICSDTSVTHGYKCEEHDVVTKDGYILRLQRIPEGLKEGKNTKHTKKQPVFLQHGILVSGVYWMLNHEAEQCLPFILADQGYDVWLANSRGNRFSARHVKLDPNGPEFWDWSWDEMTEYDLPDSIGFVVNNTGQKVYYIGHSLGTTTAMAAFSKGLLIDKVKSAVLLCPVAYLNHMTTVIAKAAADIYLAEFFLQQGIAEVDFAYEPIRTLIKLFCGTPGIDCFDFVTLFTGPNCCINASTIEFFLNNEPQPTALKNLAHLSQGVRTGKFGKYDYGSAKENIKRYGQAEAPVYNLTHIPPALPLFIVYGLYDTLADIDDVQELFNTLQLHTVQRLYIEKYAHCDFINAVDAKDLVFNQVLAFLNSQRGY